MSQSTGHMHSRSYEQNVSPRRSVSIAYSINILEQGTRTLYGNGLRQIKKGKMPHDRDLM